MITLEALLLLVSGFSSAVLLSGNFLSPFLSHSGGILIVYLLAFTGFVVCVAVAGFQPPDAARRQFIVILGTCILILFATFTRQLTVRSTAHGIAPIHDGAVQTKEAARFLLHGVNPYEADFRTTPFGAYPALYNGTTGQNAIDNIAWTHYAYPPAMILSAVPLVWLGSGVDVSLLYVLTLGLLAFLLIRVAPTWQKKSFTTVLLLGVPLVWIYPVVGFNDVMAPAMMIFSVLAWKRQRWILSGILFALALGFKQLMWLTIPLWLWLLWQHRSQKKEMKKVFWSAAAMTLLLFGPFLVWNAGALFDDLVRYVSGAIPFSYPIAGSTFLQYLRVFRLVDSPWAAIPTYLFQAMVGLPLLLLAGWWVRRRPTPEQWLTGSVVLLFAVGLVSRFFIDNHASGILTLAIGTYLLSHEEKNEAST